MAAPTPSTHAEESPTTTTARTHALRRPGRAALVAAVTALTLVGGGLASPAAQAKASTKALTVKVLNSRAGGTWSTSPVGFSIDSTELKSGAVAAGTPFAKLLKGLRHPALRIGGRPSDRSVVWIDSKHGHTAAYRGRVAIGTAELHRLKGLADYANATVTLDVPFATYDPGRAAAMVKAAHRILGKRLIGVGIGNEPNAYYHKKDAGNPTGTYLRSSSWRPASYKKQLTNYVKALKKVWPAVPVVGPDTYATPGKPNPEWWNAFSSVMRTKAFKKNYKALAIHHYVLAAGKCDSRSKVDGLSVTAALSQRTISTSANFGRVAKRAAGSKPVYMEETGLTSCWMVRNGDYVSTSHASALWAADYAMATAQVGVTRLAVHGGLLGCGDKIPTQSSPYCVDSKGRVTARPNYSGLKIVSQVPKGRFVKTKRSSGGAGVVVRTVKNSSTKFTVVIINKNSPATYRAARVKVKLPRAFKKVYMSRLAGAPVQAQHSTRIDVNHKLVSKSSSWRSSYVRSVPAGSVVTLTFQR